MKKFLLVAVVLIVLFFTTAQPKIFIGNEFQTVAVVNAEENLQLTINFIHSVQKTPVIEENSSCSAQDINLKASAYPSTWLTGNFIAMAIGL